MKVSRLHALRIKSNRNKVIVRFLRNDTGESIALIISLLLERLRLENSSFVIAVEAEMLTFLSKYSLHDLSSSAIP